MNKGPKEGPLSIDLWASTHLKSYSLLEERHDLIDHAGESIDGLLAGFDHVSILGGMPVEECKSAGIVLIDQDCTVTAATGSRGRTNNIRRYIPNRSILALEHIRRGKQTRQ